ncbi:MAG: AI-2E family transporter [Gammaproteobacteria bacterium]|nr:AI-2E family transporter [Gammaproteobacteria bacterium]
MKKNQMLIIFSIVFVGAFIYLLSPILTPFVVGILLAYLTNPLVKKLMKIGLSRTVSVSIVFLLLFIFVVLLLLLLVPIIEKQIQILMSMIPTVVEWLQNTIIPWVEENLGFNETLVNVANLKSVIADNWIKAGSAADWVVKTVLHSGFAILEWAFNLILIPVVTFYLLCDWTSFMKGLRNLLPRNIEPKVMEILSECDEVLSAFFRGQLLVMLSLSVMYSVGLTLIGLQVGILIGIISGLVSIVPYLGFIVGVISATIAAIVQFQSVTSVILVWSVFIIIHAIENMFLTPKLVGNKIGLHPVAVIFSILAGGCLFGFFGVLVALPVAAVIMVCLRYLHREYRKSELYKSE